MDGASRGLAFGAGHLRKTRLRLVGPPLLASKRRRACSSFDDRHNVSSKERSAGTQAVACQALWVIYDRCHTWIRSSAMAVKARRPRTGRQRYIAYRLMSTAPHPANQENVAPKTFHSCQPRPPTRIQKAGRKAAPKQRPPGGPKNKTAKEYYFTQKRGCQNGPKNGAAARSHFCDRSKQNLARQALAALPVAQTSSENDSCAFKHSPRWPSLAVCQPFALKCLTPLTSAKCAHAAIQLPRPLDAPCAQSISLPPREEMSAEPVFDRTPTSCNVAWQTCA